MERIAVSGGRKLYGEVRIGGSKNAALPLLFAGILSEGICVFHRLPRVGDILKTLEILKSLGAGIRFYKSGEVKVDYSGVCPVLPPAELTFAIRGSTYLLGSLLGRFGEAHLAGAGGCDFGARPIDRHLAGFEALGAAVYEEGGVLHLAAPTGLVGCHFDLGIPSVGATANLMMAATRAAGVTCLDCAAAEPHVGALAAFLGAMGAEVRATGGTVRILGNKPLNGCEFRVIPDMIEAGTYLAFGMACGGEVCVLDVNPRELACVTDLLCGIGGEVTVGERSVTLRSAGQYAAADIVAAPYPGFPTDLQPQFAALFALGDHADGISTVRDTIFPTRFRYAEELCKMGADMRVFGDTVRITPAPLHAARMCTPDLRGGAALLLAALATEGESVIERAALLCRGYEHILQKLTALGARVRGSG